MSTVNQSATQAVPAKIVYARVAHALPFTTQTIYNYHRLGMLPWLSRVSPEGRRTRALWVDVDSLTSWARARGLSINIGGSTN